MTVVICRQSQTKSTFSDENHRAHQTATKMDCPITKANEECFSPELKVSKPDSNKSLLAKQSTKKGTLKRRDTAAR